ncbi:MAG: YjjG family noncanonical pyrimidine nucleotidase [Bacilli bacterium]|nr:YjjG family noncanonical pyrimidine nucleotidase [Bacilli bacterium]MDY5745633.1 YjjG family noncanonical pyrimidine nucleotidase [Bacilli bacterium]MDY6048794.1 YjjG family noncanonical pyrimidine nucleotidase [Bacilli bacterium]
MKKIKAILYDVDGTLLDFETQEEVALSYCFKKYNLGELSEEKLELYKRINLGYWEMFEKNLITKDKLVVKRFEDYLEALGVKLNAEEVNDTYFSKLGDTIVFKDNSYELVKSLKGKIKQYVVTNGAIRVQKTKLAKSGFDKLMDDVFISDEVGYQKPRKEFFDAIKNRLGDVANDEILIVGDSLTSDMKLADNCNLISCFYNPKKKDYKVDFKIDYEISDLNEVKKICQLD